MSLEQLLMPESPVYELVLRGVVIYLRCWWRSG